MPSNVLPFRLSNPVARERLDEDNFEDYAKRAYVNNGCTDLSEFDDDLKRIRYVKRQFNFYRETGDIKILLVLNHLRVFFNVFKPQEVAAKLLVYRMMEHLDLLKPFLVYLGVWPDKVVGIGHEVIWGSDIPMDERLIELLRDYKRKHEGR